MDNATAPKAIRPCPFAIAAMTVPARRWATRADLIAQLEKARDYMDQCNFGEFTVEEAATIAGLSLHHFIRLFHEVYCKTPAQFLAQRKLQTAKALLLGRELTVLEVAVEVGFVNASAFSRWFRRATGLAPSRFSLMSSQI